MSSPSGASRTFLLGWLLFWVLILGVVYVQRQAIFDWWRLRDYQAPVAVQQLATETTMTPLSRKIFYVNHPSVDSRAQFNAACPKNGGEQTIVLGCYHSDQEGIFILPVTDQRLEGVEQVTAAHEMLHAAYDRLSSSERTKVNRMLEDYYRHDLTDVRIKTTIAAYEKTEPNDLVNEMHSIFGSEIVQLPPQLEDYYRRYFSDRQIVADYAARYQAEFTTRKSTIAQDDAQLATLKAQIDTSEANLKAMMASINNQQATLTQLRDQGDIAAYNAGVPTYNQTVSQYNADVDNLRALINRYNQLVSSHNAVAAEIDTLVQELSSQATPIKQ